MEFRRVSRINIPISYSPFLLFNPQRRNAVKPFQPTPSPSQEGNLRAVTPINLPSGLYSSPPLSF